MKLPQSPSDGPLPVTAATPGQNRFDQLIQRVGQAVAWLVFVAMLVSVYEVIMRYGFNAPTDWAHETTTFLVATIFALGGPYALATNRHIQIRILLDRLSPQKRSWLDLLNLVLGILFCLAIGYAAWVLAFNATHAPDGSWRLETSGSSWNPPLPAFIKIIILISIALMALQQVVRISQHWRKNQ
ncbi:TRAP transporter small permease subunit [Ectopseudomonas composti]|uniref:TRAP transporter small permease protein n=1 Tax=Ectopseudomonas composti TaxID=658457 RepID=A0A1I5MT70_9GAMM|nr:MULTISPECIES: TRAP transporter small permease subunit [Pseudomonas]EZH80063.1 C4-dicarboxylate ABC transporter permease [Pseudomonas composti]MDN5513621.1 TRAP transporter small permease subunit [Pseudomonas sp.]QNH06499.1 TRAP transporter small permease subunit [Pseudomonas sp. B11D7D]SFP12709.1 TRAP-type mannitol/chloroaromatic compound transport system, small permease component [Pseudomonas composti]